MSDAEETMAAPDNEEEAVRTNDYLKDQMNYLKSRFADERRKLEQRSFARKRDD